MNAADLAKLDRDALIALILKPTAIIKELHAEIEALKRSGKRRRRLISTLTTHLRDRSLSDRDNQRLLNELGRCHDAGSRGRFLDDPSIEPTNNRAKRALRPTVIAQKVSQCTKTARGTRAFEAWTSALQTLSQTRSGPDLLDALVQLTHPAAPRLS